MNIGAMRIMNDILWLYGRKCGRACAERICHAQARGKEKVCQAIITVSSQKRFQSIMPYVSAELLHAVIVVYFVSS
jgi:hypothetical protein